MRVGDDGEWHATRVGDAGTDFVPPDPRLAARFGVAHDAPPRTRDLVDNEVFVAMTADCSFVAGCNVGAALLGRFALPANRGLLLRVHAENAAHVPSVAELRARTTVWKARRDLNAAIAMRRGVADFFLPAQTAPRLAGATYPMVASQRHTATLRLVFQFTLSSGELRLETRDHADATHRSALLVPIDVRGLVVSAFLVGTAQLEHRDTPLFFDTGSNTDAPDAPIVPVDASGPGQYGEQPPPASVPLPPFVHVPRTGGTAPPKPVFTRSKQALALAPAGHPRLAECLEHRTSPVWLGLSLSGLDPRVRREMVPHSEAMLLYNDPGALLTGAGVFRLRVHVHCDYRATPDAAYVRQAPLTLCFDLTNPDTPYCVGGMFDAGASPGWPATLASY
jgi:hypothetical protein